MNIQLPPKQKKTSHWFLFLLLLLFTFISHYFTKHILFYISINKLTPLLRHYLFNYIPLSYLVHLIRYCSFLYDGKLFLIILILLYNYGNIYKTYFVFSSYTISQLILSICKLLYLEPSPLWNEFNYIPQLKEGIEFNIKELKEFQCEDAFQTPSHNILNATIFYMVTYKVVFQSDTNKEKYFRRALTIISIVLILILITLRSLLLNTQSLDQIVFGFMIGLCYYVFVIYVKKIYCNHGKQLLKLIKNKNIKYRFIILGLVVTYPLLCVLQYKNKSTLYKVDTYTKRVKSMCANTEDNKMFIKETFLLYSMIFSNVIALFAMRLEYTCMFKQHDDNWSKYNFELDELEQEKRLLLSNKITITKEIQWNHTSQVISFFRLIVIVLLFVLSSLPYYLIEWNNNIYVVIFGKICLCLCCYAFGMFFVFKLLLKWLKLSNMTLFTMLRDSI
jgi:hypothetical protein